MISDPLNLSNYARAHYISQLMVMRGGDKAEQDRLERLTLEQVCAEWRLEIEAI